MASTPMIRSIRWAATGLGVFLVGHALYKELTRFTLDNKVVVITGGSRGLGLVLARQLAKRKAKLALCARSADKLELARQQLVSLGAEVITIPCDVTDHQQVRAMMYDVVKHYGRIDVLINNAGTIQVGPYDNMEIADFERAMEANFWSQLFAVDAVLPYFRKSGRGRIVNITSIGGKIAFPHLLPYSASKFAAVGLSEGLTSELARENIIVTTVVPNLMRTGSPRNATIKGHYDAEYAWFKAADSSPVTSQSAEKSAKEIINALELGEKETTLSLSGKLATAIQGIAPGWVSTMLAVTNKILPKPVEGSDSVKGYQAESRLSQNPLNSSTDEAARKNNEL